MKTLLALIFAVQTCLAQDAYFFEIEQNEPQVAIKNESMTVTMAIKRVSPPKVSSIVAYHQGLGVGRDYQIQINLSEKAKLGWIPKLKLDGDILVEGVSVSRPDIVGISHSFSVESSDKDKILKWVAMLGKLLNVPQDKIKVELKIEADKILR